jgi:tetratricopeptide (TPR) repeat protein
VWLKLAITLLLLGALSLGLLYHRPTAQWIQQGQVTQQMDQLLARRNWIGVRELAERQLSLFPRQPAMLKAMALYYRYQAKNPQQAAYWYDQLLQATPGDVTARLAYAHILHKSLKQPDKALTVLWQGSQRQPDSPVFPYQIGLLYYQTAHQHHLLDRTSPESQATVQRLLGLAKQYFTLTLARQKTHFGATLQLGHIALQTRHWDTAALYFCHCVVMAPQHTQSVFNLGHSLLAMGLPEAGKRILQAGIHLPEQAGDRNGTRALLQQAHTLHKQYDATVPPPESAATQRRSPIPPEPAPSEAKSHTDSDHAMSAWGLTNPQLPKPLRQCLTQPAIRALLD